MAIYRAEQARFSFASEAGHGGFPDFAHTYADASSAWSGDVATASIAGARSMSIERQSGSGTLALNELIRVGSRVSVAISGNDKYGGFNAEIRKVVKIVNSSGASVSSAGSGTYTIYVEQPFAFPHAASELAVEANPAGIDGDSYITFLPGVYEAVTVPDLTPELTPQYFLSTGASRNWTTVYRGRQTFNGSLSNFIMLNGYALKYGIGRAGTVGTAVGSGGASTLANNTQKGQTEIKLAAATNYTVGDHIQVDTGANAEVRVIASIDGTFTTQFRLNYPLMNAHASGANCYEVVAPFVHTMTQDAELQSMTWNVFMRDTDEDADNDFVRRYVGGMVNTMTLSADEGEMLRCSWDNVNFLDMVHNQRLNVVTTPKATSALIDPTAEAGATNNVGIGGDRPRIAGTSPANLGHATYPTTEPYYFSQGELTFFGQTFARVRSFRLDVNNNIEPRFYINSDGTNRIVSDMQEQRREWRMTATIAMEDATASSTSTAKTLWRELILEGEYGSGMQGFDMVMTFTRGVDDTIVIKSPGNATTNNAGSGTGFGAQGCFIVSAPHNIGAESPLSLDVEILVRDVSIVCTDSVGVYP